MTSGLFPTKVTTSLRKMRENIGGVVEPDRGVCPQKKEVARASTIREGRPWGYFRRRGNGSILKISENQTFLRDEGGRGAMTISQERGIVERVWMKVLVWGGFVVVGLGNKRWATAFENLGTRWGTAWRWAGGLSIARKRKQTVPMRKRVVWPQTRRESGNSRTRAGGLRRDAGCSLTREESRRGRGTT